MFKPKQENKLKKRKPFRTKVQILEMEEVEKNGVILQVTKLKTKTFKPDPNLSIYDFNILNLQRINALGQLTTSQLPPTIDQISRNAESANEVLEQIDIIKSLGYESNETQNEGK